MNARVRSTAAVALVGVLLAGAVGGCSPGPTLEGHVLPSSQLTKQGDTVYLVLFADQADLSGVDAITDWDARGAEVVRRLRATAAAAQKDAIAAVEKAGADYSSLWIANALAVIGDAKLGDAIAGLAGVQKVWQEEVPSLEVPAPQAPANATADKGWALQALGVPEARARGFTGKGITVGFIDTGAAYAHPAIADEYRGRSASGAIANDHNWYAPLRTYRGEPVDVGNHGTSTVGLAVGKDGVAPGAQWIAAMGCAAEGCPLASVLMSMQFMIAPSLPDGSDPDPSLRPQIVNDSWVRGAEVLPLVRASRALAAAGIFQTFAVGNSGPDCGSASPMGEWPTFVTVGAETADGGVAPFSSRGPTRDGWLAPDVIAPGARVWAPISPDGYAYVSGTSFAAPMVAGVVALMMEANPDLIGRPDAVAHLLRAGAAPVADEQCRSRGLDWPNDGAGYGAVDAAKTVALGCDPSGDWAKCTPVAK